MKNQEIRAAVKKYGMRFWMIAEKLGIQDSALSRKMRKELGEEEKDKIFSIIEELSREVVS